MALSKNQLKEIAKWDKFIGICSTHVEGCNCNLVQIDIEQGFITVRRQARVFVVALDPWELRVVVADVTAYVGNEGATLPIRTYAAVKTDLEELMRFVRGLCSNRVPGDRSQVQAVAVS